MVACNENLTSAGYAQIRLICAGFTEVLGDTGPRIVDPARVAATSRGEGRALLATASWVESRRSRACGVTVVLR